LLWGEPGLRCIGAFGFFDGALSFLSQVTRLRELAFCLLWGESDLRCVGFFAFVFKPCPLPCAGVNLAFAALLHSAGGKRKKRPPQSWRVFQQAINSWLSKRGFVGFAPAFADALFRFHGKKRKGASKRSPK
jgi:hypothetical protein